MSSQRNVAYHVVTSPQRNVILHVVTSSGREAIYDVDTLSRRKATYHTTLIVYFQGLGFHYPPLKLKVGAKKAWTCLISVTRFIHFNSSLQHGRSQGRISSHCTTAFET
ncbi:hypothetical protein PoB_003639900 [Plakobranchus ocellatus]|uniref:Uncharacterized protein n=1 Tax=Plakobranchus ocellatus TaxID=259542 RepID=A0AAV4AU79_9GAST|nr:hypothetical protein PoB_003639900 [Plakobranchus ocellatus]